MHNLAQSGDVYGYTSNVPHVGNGTRDHLLIPWLILDRPQYSVASCVIFLDTAAKALALKLPIQ
jgi:hypothetical protein